MTTLTRLFCLHNDGTLSKITHFVGIMLALFGQYNGEPSLWYFLLNSGEKIPNGCWLFSLWIRIKHFWFPTRLDSMPSVPLENKQDHHRFFQLLLFSAFNYSWFILTTLINSFTCSRQLLKANKIPCMLTLPAVADSRQIKLGTRWWTKN